MGEKKRGAWKRLLEHLKVLAPTLAGGVGTAVGTAVGGPIGPALGSILATAARVVVGAKADADLDDVAGIILGDPQLTLEMERLAVEKEKAYLDLERVRMEQETARLQAVNATIQAEAAGEDPWTRRWRPYTGFVTASTWGLMGLSFAVAVILAACGVGDASTAVATIGGAFADLAMFFAVPLAILGVASWKRGDMQVARVKTKAQALLGGEVP